MLTGVDNVVFGKPRPDKIERACVSMDARRAGSSCDCSSARRSLATAVSSFCASGVISESA